MADVVDASTQRLRSLAPQFSNWGRWPDSEIGTLNLISSEKRRAATALIQRGDVISLSIEVGSSGPQPGTRRQNPVHLMCDVHTPLAFGGPMRISDDFVAMHLQSGSQLDGLAHVSYDGFLFDGVPESAVTAHGASRLGIEHVFRGVIGRGVLLDLALHLGVEWLEGGQIVTASHLEGAAADQGVVVGEGDIVLLRTGWRKMFLTNGSRAKFMESEPGLGIDAALWLRQRDVAAVCADNFGVEVIPSEREVPPMSVHMLLIRDAGMTLGEIFDLEELAADCKNDGIYEFFVAAVPLPITGGVGSPVNAVAIK